jgi:hypothetical protein
MKAPNPKRKIRQKIRTDLFTLEFEADLLDGVFFLEKILNAIATCLEFYNDDQLSVSAPEIKQNAYRHITL